MINDGKCRFSSKDGNPIYHFLNASTFTQYTVLDSACVLKLDPMAPLKTMTLLSCGVSTGLGAVWNTADVQAGETIAVFGLGGVGLAVVEGARIRGASKIIGVDTNSKKRIKGEAVGITHFINPKELDKPVHEAIHEMTGGGVHYSFECVGDLDVFRDAFLSTSDGWGLTVILGIHTSPRMLSLHPMELFDGRRVVGSVFGDFKGKSQLPHFAKQCMQGVVKLDEFITHEMEFQQINDAFQLLIEGKSMRCLLHL
ncbi:PREDICTED: alcohol dehydrogenase-like 3 [Ipomoea nil]|uniref:alcohol dehydrogenase-like 3 n=1 Tax=Ipomoea nil TaxID=35883 RepID=UPI0009013F22|nr:PREDICTED: alcohol dehydrogenase-like 3 [Ipomoea nil]